MKYIIRPEDDPKWFKPAPWRVLPIPGSTQRYLVIERTLSKEEAGPNCRIAEFVSTNEQIRKRHGKGFSAKRIQTGQASFFYLVEYPLDRAQIYVAKSLDKVRSPTLFCTLVASWDSLGSKVHQE